jgi:SAM-dependent methyltransferase
MPWYEEFFDEDYMRFHLVGGQREADRAPAECDFIVNALGLKPGDRVLDLCCGQGRHAVELARRGFEVTGADLSGYLLGLARDAAQQARVEVRFHRGDMRELPWEEEFDAVIVMFTAFGYFDSEEDNEKVLREVRKALRPGGRLLLDLPNRDVFLNLIADGQRTWYEHEGHLVLDEHTWDSDRRRLRLSRTIVAPDGTRRQTGHDLREYTHPEIVDPLARAGLQWQRTFADLNMTEFDPEARRMLIIGRRGE